MPQSLAYVGPPNVLCRERLVTALVTSAGYFAHRCQRDADQKRGILGRREDAPVA